MGAIYTNYFRKDHITLIIFYAGLCYFSYTGYSTHPCAILVAAQAQSPQRSFMRFHMFGSPRNDVVDTAAPRAVSGPDASSTYITWTPARCHSVGLVYLTRMPHASPLRVAHLHHSDAPCATARLSCDSVSPKLKLLRVRTRSTLGNFGATPYRLS